MVFPVVSPSDRYICSVLRTESWPGWPLEVNKVFAIASRSYVISMMQAAKAKKRLYHVCNTNLHQTYTGAHNVKALYDAVDQTRGLFLTYEGQPILAMFDSCCGGVIPAHIADFNFERVPYLARAYPCMYCKNCTINRWHIEYDRKDLEKIFSNAIPDISTVKNMYVSKKDNAGIVQTIIIEPGSYKLSGKKLYSLVPDIKSFCFTIKRNKNRFSFNGYGFGHHLGLCQWGAREMVREGLDYKRILYFYYPGAQLSRLI